ncbi:Serine/threonine-protein kinase tel1 [Penicillium rolfsii]|nr:Serine/threonine-protein kinase tel1 [Penicillium rolfsii]
MGEIYVDKALGLLSSDKLKERVDGLAALKKILQQNKHSPKLVDLGDKACHKIFEALFRFVAVERPIYIRAQRSNTKSPSATRLSTCASVLRAAVDIFLRNIRAKTVRAIIDHITETIPVPGDGLWAPLSGDYMKCLASILQYPPHIEHLGHSDWERLIDFCLDVINTQQSDESQLSIRSGHRSAPEDSLDASDGRSTPQRMTPAPGNREKFVGDRNTVGEVLACIQLLTSSPSAPIHSAAESIMKGLVELVKSSCLTAGNAHQLAFSSINTVVSRVLFDQSELARSFLTDLIPVIRRLWSTKLQSLKDELLATIMLCLIIFADAAYKKPSESLVRLVEGLASSLQSEYVKRPDRELLQADETVFYQKGGDGDGPIYGPRLGNARSEHNWTVIWALANMLKLTAKAAVQDLDQAALGEVSSKRQRLASGVDDVFRDAISGTSAQKICALQMVPFLEAEVDIDTKQSFVQRVIPNILDDNSTVSTWTMIALTSVVKGPSARHHQLKGYWPQAVTLATRAFSSAVTSRAACTFLSAAIEGDLLDYSILSENIRSMLSSANLNGPSSISDSALSMWASIARKRLQLTPGTAKNASQQICSWLREVWTIGNVTDRLQTAQIATFARPLDLLNLFMACTNRPFEIPDFRYRGPSSLITRMWFYFHENEEILKYMFGPSRRILHSNPWKIEGTWSLKPSVRPDADDLVIIEILRAKSEMFLQSWNTINEDKSLHITTDILQILISFCIVCSLFEACLPQQSRPRAQGLQQNCNTLWKSICNFMSSHVSTAIQPCLEIMSPILALEFELEFSGVGAALYPLLRPLVDILENLRQTLKEDSQNQRDIMELDDRLTHGGDEVSVNQSILFSNRAASCLFPDANTFQRCETVRFSILLRTQIEIVTLEDPLSTIVEYLKDLDESDLLSTQGALPAVYRKCSKLQQNELVQVLEDLGEKCLQSYEMERCEASHNICIQMMTALATSWTNPESVHLSESAMDLYSWFMEALVSKKRASTKVYIALSMLVQAVLELCPSYGNQQSLPSPRTTLFMILQDGDVQVKFSVADFLPKLFERFLLKDHDAIFDDVLESLPRDPDWIEGIALRLLVLSRLASKWHTLLRRSIYHMFETPAQVPDSLGYAQSCVKSTSAALGLRDGRELFRLFASQILYTWTETQSFMSLPYSIFGYGTLREMLIDVKDEVVGQMMMRAKESETLELASFLDIPHIELLKTSFHKAEAYSIARDISTPPEQGSQPKGVEIRLRKLLGPESFMTQIEENFSQIIATFFRTLDRHDQIERAYSKRPGFQHALDVQARISQKGASQNSLPPNQQPSFRARYLLDELEFLCKRAGFELETIWSPALAIYVCRSLLESIHPAMGSLHTCSVIRKIRVLVCLAGPIMLENYPFEMILNAFRPFIADVHCSEDALGVLWYLLEAGKDYLLTNPGFTAGICLSTLVTLRRLFLSSPESTTQQTQFQAVLSTAQNFREWLCGFVDECLSLEWSNETRQSFAELLNLARKLPSLTNISNVQVENDLVYAILKDRDSTQSLLSKPFADLVLSLLCPEFRGDVKDGNSDFDSELDPGSHVFSLWETLHKFDDGPMYQLWAARVIGRSFAATGKIDEKLMREQDHSLFQIPHSNDHSDPAYQSKTTIIQLLCSKLQAQDQAETGLIERTLQAIISNSTEAHDFQAYVNIIPESLMPALLWNPYSCPKLSLPTVKLDISDLALQEAAEPTPLAEWARNATLSLSSATPHDPIIGPLRAVLHTVPGLAVQVLPYIIHEVLLSEDDREGRLRQAISGLFNNILCTVSHETMPHARLVITCILYLRNQPISGESTIIDRDQWLEIDYGQACSAAHQCGLQKTSLLFLEIEASRVISGSRRSSVAKYEPPVGLLHDIFKNIDDPDLFYGIQQSSSLATVMERLEYESSGLKNLLFQSAQYDSEVQMSDNPNPSGVLRALNSTNLQGIANTMLSASGSANNVPASFNSMLQAATSLQQWDIPVSPLDNSPSATVFRAFQSLNTSASLSEVAASLDNCLLTTLKTMSETGQSTIDLRNTMRALGIMTEMCDILQVSSAQEMKDEWEKIMARSSWLKTESYIEVGEILSWHEALFSSIRKNAFLTSKSNLSSADSRLLEAKVFRQSLEITRSHGVSQASLKSAISLSKLAEPCAELGMNIDGAAKFDLANVLWDQGEMTASIRMLQQLKGQGDLHKQAIPLSRAELLVTLGHYVAEARLEKPESILQEYLYPAVKELKGVSEGESAGRVYHGFASFCDQQLLNVDGMEDFKRVKQLRDRKEKELLGLEDMMKNAEGREKESVRIFRAKAKQWFDLDDREYQRLLRSREAFLQQCLENYLLALRESEIYNNDALRFCALWLDQSDSKTANTAVSRYISDVPSRKFAPLMNQLSSRLLDVTDDFQSLLTGLVFRICAEHPFHGMYQIFASSKSKGGKDQSSHSRFRAANKLVERLKNDKEIGPTWISVHNMNITYVRFAIDKPDSKFKTGAKIPLKKLPTGDRLGKDAETYKLPPPTMKIELRADMNYSDVPSIARFSSEFTLASGVSAPKIVSAIATNGVRYKQLFKGGNDDLRQDAIMEQVFEQVSSLLKDHQPTRQRNLGIRTYKVLPLTLNAGIIEFVPNTIPLHDYLMPAHQRYFPKDMKPSACRKHIADVQTRSFEQRVRTYRQVTEHFHPVMKYFFIEKFSNPDDWFSKRLAYTRSTAAISILGHVLGLGDRHGHNILLDEKTGEVVHIDLGVAFEQGRVLPVPEVVPFRLTRDLVDGFGLTKTEGVFRRCCEFTLEALRQESYSIMTILDVLRYDPLYSWTVSPLRMKKMQDNQDAGDGPPVLPGAQDKPSTNEPSEADRALTVVAKKLSKTLSVTATVNELIQQATDEKNLAVLYCGWASYA